MDGVDINPESKSAVATHCKIVADIQQAKIDELMLEYCPGEMSRAQMEEWEQHQRRVDDRTQQEIDKVLGL